MEINTCLSTQSRRLAFVVSVEGSRGQSPLLCASTETACSRFSEPKAISLIPHHSHPSSGGDKDPVSRYSDTQAISCTLR